MVARNKVALFIVIVFVVYFALVLAFRTKPKLNVITEIHEYNIHTLETQDSREVTQNLNQKSFDCPFDEHFHLLEHLPKPEFILIGVAKGGTTSFSNYLPSHPNVKSVDPKEPNFWTWHYRTTERYQNMFVNVDPILTSIEPRSDEIISGEYTTSYILHPLVPKRMHSELPNVKIIMILRNPIDRAYSHYTMSKRARIETLSFEEIIEKEFEEIEELRLRSRECFNDNTCDPSKCFPTKPLHKHDQQHSEFYMTSEKIMKDYYYISYLFRSIYDDSVERWLAVYPREQILILKSEDMFEDNEKIMQEVSKFLQLPYYDFSSAPILDKTWGGGASNKYENPHDYPPITDETRARLREFFEPYNKRLYEIVGRDFGWE